MIIGTKNSAIEYLLFGEMKENFTIDSLTGIILPKYPMDFEQLEGPPDEQVRALHLTVRARDKGTPSLSTDCALTIYVHDVNDHTPFFEYVFYNKTLPETTPGGTPILQVNIPNIYFTLEIIYNDLTKNRLVIIQLFK